VRGRYDSAETFFAQDDCPQAGCFRDGNRARECCREAAFGEHFPDALRSSLFEMERDERISPAVFMEQASEERLRWWADVAQTQLTLLARGGAAHAAH
jgi:hypothetical protein